VIETVRGPIRPDELGITSMHDHVLGDASSLQRPGASPAPALDRVDLDSLGYLRWNALASADNLRLDDEDTAVAELLAAGRTGMRAVVDCSSWGLGPRHASYPRISRDSGVTVVSAYGAYIPRTVPGWVAQMTEQELEAHFFDALTVAIPGTSFRAGMLGIMGTTEEFTAREREQLRAAARAAARAGASVSVRLEPEARNGLEILDLIAREGLAADRVVLTNADEYPDAAYWADLIACGAVLEMCFGTEQVHDGRMDNPSDRERLAFFADAVARHPEARLVLGESVWTKMQLRAYGGYGYGYLIERIVPALLARRVDSRRIERMLVDEPRRLLDR
jgi:phosphotriesterase-related protein